ncbi:MAG: hypothetical protein Q4D14_04445 [Bacteroidales bacterium]|nr:hypothetical protein [Bacteroidales bacterium]
MTKIRLKYILLLGMLLVGLSPLHAQHSEMATTEIELDSLFVHLTKAESDSVRTIINDSILTIITDMMDNVESFNYPFERLDYFGKIYSTDHRLRIYSWCFPLAETLSFYCIIQTNDGGWQLLQNSQPTEPKENQLVNSRNWYGALYYEAIPCKFKAKKVKGVYYVLAGWGRATGDALNQYKVLEVLELDEENNLSFGRPVFKDEERLTRRRVFRYDAQTGMNVLYDVKAKAFYVDHLSPLKLTEDGQPLTYGVDMSVDAFKLKAKLWQYKANVNAKNQK